MNIILIGPPGVGKGTQSSYLVSHYNLGCITTGDLLRKEAKHLSELGQSIRDAIASGILVSDEIVDKLIMLSVSNAKKGILFDGYPRTVQQAKTLDNILKQNNRKLHKVINMTLSDDVLIKRVSGRFVCSVCSSVYNSYFVNTQIKGKCDKCGSSDFITRSDDSEEIIRKRLEIFHKENKEILKYYADASLLVDIVCDASVEDISKDISYVIDKNNVSI